MNVPATFPVESKKELFSFDLFSSAPASLEDPDDEVDSGSSVEDGESVTYCVFTTSVGLPFTVFTENTVVALCVSELDDEVDEVVWGADEAEENGDDDDGAGAGADDDGAGADDDDDGAGADDEDQLDEAEDKDDEDDEYEEVTGSSSQVDEDDDVVGSINEDEDEVLVDDVDDDEVVVGVLEVDVEEDVLDVELEVVSVELVLSDVELGPELPCVPLGSPTIRYP